MYVITGYVSGREVLHPALFCCHASRFVVEKRLTRQEETAAYVMCLILHPLPRDWVYPLTIGTRLP
jgi:hypothetical protein